MKFRNARKQKKNETISDLIDYAVVEALTDTAAIADVMQVDCQMVRLLFAKAFVDNLKSQYKEGKTMKVKIVKGNAVKTVEEIRAEKMEMLKRNVIESCTRSIAEADAIAYAVSCDDNFVLELIARTLLNYAKRSREDE